MRMSFLAMVLGLVASSPSVAQGIPDHDHLVAGQLLIKPHQDLRGQPANAWPSTLRALSRRTGVELTFRREVLLGWGLIDVRLSSGVMPTEAETAAVADRIAKDGAIAQTSINGWKRIQRIPNDPGFNQMWHLTEISAPVAWDISTGLSGQRIGIIDTGLVLGHEDVGSRAVGGFDFVSDFGQANDGDSRDGNYNDPGDDCGGGDSWHGTHVAGTIGASTDNSLGIAGLNWSAGLVIARALGRCGGDTVDIMDAMAWLAGVDVPGAPAVGGNRVSVENLSLGGFGECTAYEQDVVSATIAQGVTIVAATGNDGGAVNSPANCTGVLTVAAFGPDRARTAYSSFGPEVEIVGPGGVLGGDNSGGVLSTLGPSTDTYAFYEGTSMATPHVTGVVSLMQARNPNLTPAEVMTLLQQNGDTCSGCGAAPALNAARAVAAVPDVVPPPPPPPPPTDDVLEDNDTSSSARALGCGSSLQLQSFDEDWFRIGANGLVQINIDGGTSDQVDLFLFPITGGDPLVTSATTSGVEAISTTVASGEYFVAVTPFNGGGPYSLTLNCTGIDDESNTPTEPGTTPPPPTPPPTPNSDDDLEDNDTAAAAQYLGCRNRGNLQLLDDDWFIIDTRAGDRLQVSAATGSISIEQDGAVLAEGSGELVIDAVGQGDVLVHLTPDGGASPYRLEVVCGTPLIVSPTAVGGCQSGSLPLGLPVALATLLSGRWHRRRNRG
jgi:serine protease